MEYVHVTKDNIEEEHICCAISNNKDVQVSSSFIDDDKSTVCGALL